ncbi:M48 family metalloprotease [Alphaproteobacteria bacterium]|nr:M48 family metalloprotease [Alphaproteobacteria bacterium]
MAPKQARGRFRPFLGVFLLFCAVLTALPASAGTIRDTEIEATIEDMIAPLADAAGFAPGEIKVRIIIDDNVNAFVQSGHTIFINSGLVIDDVDVLQFIGVMAHELAHIKAGHVQRIDENLTQAKSAIALASIAAVAMAAGGQGDAAAGVLIGGNDRAGRNLLSSVRQNEAVADEIGLALLDEVGVSGTGLRDMMARLSRQRALPQSRQSKYYSTHPGAAQRLQTYQDHVNRSPFSDTLPDSKIVAQFNRVRTKMIAWTQRPLTVLAGADPALDPDLRTYAKSIANYRRGDLEQALADIDALIAAAPKDPYFHEFKGDILMSMAQPIAAAASYERAITIRPNSPQIKLLLGRALIATNDKERLSRAIEVISSARTEEPSWAILHRQLGIAYGRAGMISEADMSLAEEAILSGNNVRAVQLAKRTLARDSLAEPLRNRANDIIFRYGKDD